MIPNCLSPFDRAIWTAAFEKERISRGAFEKSKPEFPSVQDYNFEISLNQFNDSGK